MSKILVDSLPYYGDTCPFQNVCCDYETDECPIFWNKYKVCSEENTGECCFLKELKEDK